MSTDEKNGKKLIATNRKAFHDYYVEERLEAGVQLFGTEVKSLRQGAVNLKDSYCVIEKGELFATGIHISPYEKGNIYNRDPLRNKKLLLHKKEIRKLIGQIGEKGVAIIPLSLYFSGSYVKAELGVCRGKKLYDKREDLAKKQAEREMERYHKSNRFS
ncbi:MAG: SsrA-binding protein SmpB [Clostridia bacterium]|nr:SsrA-binding protein SmpB [Clostridia bacterium]